MATAPIAPATRLPAASAQILQRVNGFQKIGLVCLLAYLLVLMGRTGEVSAKLLGGSFLQTSFFLILTVIFAAISGALVESLRSTTAKLVLGMSLWMVATSPMSTWRGGTLQGFVFLIRILPAFFLIAGLVVTPDNLRRVMSVIAFAFVIVLAFVALNPEMATESRLRMDAENSSFGNSNEIAIYLLIGIPFWLYVTANSRYPRVIRWGVIPLTGAAIVVAFRTGSRSGFVTIMVLAVLLLVKASMANRIKLLLAAIVVLPVAWVMAPESVVARYQGLIREGVSDTTGAASSKESRWALFLESLDVTARHPLFGVGYGVYAPAAATASLEAGQRAKWQVTHNAFTQVSAELGIPCALAYLATFWFAIRDLWRIRKAYLHQPEAAEVLLAVNAIGLSIFVFLLNALFTSMAWSNHFYVLMGLAAAISRLAGIAAAPGRRPVPATPPVRSFSALGPARPLLPADAEPASPYGDVPWARSPRRRDAPPRV
jgi:hypothetical protein